MDIFSRKVGPVSLPSALAIFLVIAGTLYYAVISTPKPISYQCENGTKFVLEVENRDSLRLTTENGDSVVLHQETDDGAPVQIYGDAKNAITFSSGYGDQVIKTDRNGPRSTICNS